MERYIVALIGGIIAVAALVFLIRLAIMLITGVKAEATVIAVKEPQRGSYVHRMRFEVDGKMFEADDKTGYSQPFSVGDTRSIVYSPKDPAKFEYESQLKKNMVITGVLVVMAVLIVLRFMFFVRDGEMAEDIKMALTALRSM